MRAQPSIEIAQGKTHARHVRIVEEQAFQCGNGSLFHRTVFEQIGLYDDRWTPHYHGDSELTMRAERAGIARWVSPAPLVTSASFTPAWRNASTVACASG